MELTKCSSFSHINKFLLPPTSAFPLSSSHSPLTVQPSPSPVFINILLLLAGPEMHIIFSTDATRAAGCVFLYY